MTEFCDSDTLERKNAMISTNTSTTKKVALVSLLALGTISFILTMAIAVILFLQRNKFHLETHPLVYLMPGYLLFPLFASAFAYTKIKQRNMAESNAASDTVLSIRLWMTFTVTVAYSALLLSMSLVAAAVH